MMGGALLDLVRLLDRLLLKGTRKTKNSKDKDDDNGEEIDRIARNLTSRLGYLSSSMRRRSLFNDDAMRADACRRVPMPCLREVLRRCIPGDDDGDDRWRRRRGQKEAKEEKGRRGRSGVVLLRGILRHPHRLVQRRPRRR